MAEMPIPEDVLEAWDRLDGAVDRVVCALPAQMTSASENLEVQRKAFRTILMAAAVRGFKRSEA